MRRFAVLVFLLTLAAAGCSRHRPPPLRPAALVVSPAAAEPFRGAVPAVVSRLTALGLEPVVRRIAATAGVDRTLVDLAGDGRRLVVCLGPVCETALFTIAPGEPTIRWIAAPGRVHGSNLASIEFAWEETAYVAGAMAATAADRPVVWVDREGCPERVVIALRGGLHSRTRRFQLVSDHGVRVDFAVVCNETGERPEARWVIGLCGARPEGSVAVARADVPSAVARVARDVVVENLPGRAYRFDLASALLRLEVTADGRRALSAEALAAADEAAGEVISGVAEIEVLGL